MKSFVQILRDLFAPRVVEVEKIVDRVVERIVEKEVLPLRHRLLDFALKFYGIQEIAGAEANPIIVEMFKVAGGHQSDETAWCSAYVNYCCSQMGLPYTGLPNARSWLEIGRKVDKADFMDIVVLWRGKKIGWKGHVGFYIGGSQDSIFILGGNQENSVSIQAYPKRRLLNYIRVYEA